jgi:aryl-alcohol dehydrogenase-like predicted oxidoreductase
LKRLQTDYVDLYQLHSPGVPFLQSAAFGESLQCLERLKQRGKIRFYGVATEVPAEAPFCLAAPGISSLQVGFGLLDPEALDAGTLAAAQARGLGIIARGCFAGGLLKDGLDAAQLEDATSKWQRILALRALSKTTSRPLLDMALQFCRGTSSVSVTLLGMRTPRHLDENLSLLGGRPLTAAEYAAIHKTGNEPAESLPTNSKELLLQR